MTNKNAFFSLKDKVFDDVLLPLKESLDKADESVGEKILSAKFKDPWLARYLSMLLPGVDRIYKGDMILGLVKTIFFAIILASVGAVVMADNLGKGLSITGLMLWFACYLLAWAWFVADIFLVHRGIKHDNLAKIFEILQETKQK